MVTFTNNSLHINCRRHGLRGGAAQLGGDADAILVHAGPRDASPSLAVRLRRATLGRTVGVGARWRRRRGSFCELGQQLGKQTGS